jgi:hypothetical protein
MTIPKDNNFTIFIRLMKIQIEEIVDRLAIDADNLVAPTDTVHFSQAVGLYSDNFNHDSSTIFYN